MVACKNYFIVESRYNSQRKVGGDVQHDYRDLVLSQILEVGSSEVLLIHSKQFGVDFGDKSSH